MGVLKMGHVRMKPEVRKEEVLDAAVEVACAFGYYNFRREDVADEAGVSPATINNYFNTMTQLRRAVMRRAIKQGVLKIVAQGLAQQDACALKAPEDVKKAAIVSLL